MAESESTEDLAYKITLEGGGVKIDTELDQETARQVVELVMGGAPAGGARVSRRSPVARRRGRGGTRSSDGDETKVAPRRRPRSPGIIKELSLRPSGKQGFVDFAEEKMPSSHKEKQAVAVHWLQDVAEIDDGITVSHVNTCYQEARWPRPTDLIASLRLTASKTGWLDTSDAENISTTTRGEDFIRHSLPAQKD